MKSCGTCGMCCKLMAIPALEKPAASWCPKYVMKTGCGDYEGRPQACRAFECLYLTADGLGDEWRPDKAKFMIWTGREERRLIVDVDPSAPMAWRQQPYYRQIKAWSDRRHPQPFEVAVRVNGRLTIVFPEADIDLGAEQPLPIESGYDGSNRPFARYVRT
jgi:hypothetical protein